MGMYNTANGGKKFIASDSMKVVASRIVGITHHSKGNIEVEFEDIDHENLFFDLLQKSTPTWVYNMLEDDEQREAAREFAKQLYEMLQEHFEDLEAIGLESA